ncbi:MAG: FtsX-like permease family protein [Candidatus Bathyarchaeia archaeon]
MDFDSQDNWLNAAKLGAKAVIFIGSEEITRIESEQKFILTPLYFPRIYLPEDEGLAIREMIQKGEIMSVRIKSKIAWKQVTAENLMAIIPGQELTDEIIIVGAYYDSWSVIPKISPGAEEAISPSILLEIARLLKENPPKRTVWLVFYSGYWQALAGPRHFVEDFYFQNQTFSSGEKRILLNVGIQITSRSDTLSMVMSGDLYAQPLYSKPYGVDDVYRFIMRDWLPILSEELSCDFSYHFQDWQTLTIAKSELLVTEPSSVAGISSFTFLTTNDLKIYVGTPSDTLDRISWKNLNPQIFLVSSAILGLANQDFKNTNIVRYYQLPQRRIWRGTGASIGPGQAGFCRLIGTVEEYNFTEGFYRPVPGAIVEVIRVSPKYSFNPFARMLTLANERGEYEVVGVMTDLLGGSYRVHGYVIDQSGRIIYAPDLGIYGAGGGMYAGYNFLNVRIDRDPMFVKTIVFQCRSVVLFDIINPLLMQQYRRALHFYSTDIEMPPCSLIVNEFISHSAPTFYGMITPRETGDNIAILFLDLETKAFEVILTTTTPEKPTQPFPMGLLINSSNINPRGFGYSSDIGVIKLTGFEFLKDLIYVDNERAETLVQYRMLSPSAKEYYNLARIYFEKARQELEKMSYSKAYDYLIAAWNFEANAYLEIRGLLQDLINASIVFILIMVPFLIIFERLVFSGSGLKRFLKIATLSIFLVFCVSILHPGFALASNIAGGMLGFIALIVSIPIPAIIFGNMSKYAKELKSKVLGKHFAEISRSEAFLLAISVGISNLRRRLLRTVLNLITIIIVIFSLVSFTSLSFYTGIKSYYVRDQSPYPGMMLRQHFGMIPFSPQIISLLSTYFGDEAIIAPRSWVYPPPSGEETLYSGSWTAGLGSTGLQSGIQNSFVYGPNGTKALIKALLGLTPKENEVTNIHLALTPNSRWFVEGEIYSCIINSRMQSDLNVSLRDKIRVMGIELTVIGIADSNILKNIIDINGESIAPLNIQKAPISPTQTFIPLSWDYIIIVPFDLAYNIFNGRINTIAVKTSNFAKISDTVSKLVMGVFQNLEVFVGMKDGRVVVYRRGLESAFQGVSMILFPAIIGGLTIITTLLGALIERKREIAVYSSVGLSPLHVAGMFLAESLTYAVLGSFLGYFFGILGIRLLLFFGFFTEGITVNFSSLFVFVSLAFSTLMVLLSSLYPSHKASLLVTPSLKRKWEITTKPIGDDWTIPLPFRCIDDEVDGVLRFLSELFEIYTSRDAGTFLVRKKEIQEKVTFESSWKELIAEMSLAPWDSGTIQNLFIRAIKENEEWAFYVHLKYIAGDKSVWIKRNPKVVDIIRKQLLLWRSLKEEEKRKYTYTSKNEG